jgi:UDP-glucose 4-epimerase
VARVLIENGALVTVVDNLVNGRRENLAGLPQDCFRLEVADVRDTSAMARLLARCDLVFHLACLGVRHSIHSPRENHEVNATATLQLLAAAQDAHVERFVYVSTSEVYGSARSVPMTEDHPTAPMTVYGASKLAAESYARSFYTTYGFPTVIVRPFNTYGPRCHHEGDSGEVIPRFLLRCMTGRPMIIFGDGMQTRDFTYVSDTAAGIVAAGTAASIAMTLNLGSGQEISINALAEVIAQTVGQTGCRTEHDTGRPGDVQRLLADTTRAASLFGYEAKTTLSQGIAKLHAWYLECGKTPAELLEEEILHNWERRGVAASR